MPRIFGYGRVSSDGQHTIPEQKIIVDRYAEYLLANGGYDKYVGFYEEVFSAVSTKFTCREMGARICAELRPGDIIVAAFYDRFVRGAEDLIDLLKLCKERKANFVALDLNIDSSTSAGEMMLEMMASIKGYETREFKRRAQAGIERRIEATGFFSNPPAGWYWIRSGLIGVDHPARNMGEYCLSYICKCETQHRDVLRNDMGKDPEFQPLLDEYNSTRTCGTLNPKTVCRLAAFAACEWQMMTAKDLAKTYYSKVSSHKQPLEHLDAIRVMKTLVESDAIEIDRGYNANQLKVLEEWRGARMTKVVSRAPT